MNRSDKEAFLFGYGSIYDPNDLNSNIFNDISQRNITHTFFSMARGGVKRNTQKRGITMYQFGSTTGPARYPLYKNAKSKNGFSMFPRPVTKCRPGELGQTRAEHSQPFVPKASDRDLDEPILRHRPKGQWEGDDAIPGRCGRPELCRVVAHDAEQRPCTALEAGALNC